ncbi:MAG: hypothetical protein ACFNLJ_06470, partial [Selenomonas artemidis]
LHSILPKNNTTCYIVKHFGCRTLRRRESQEGTAAPCPYGGGITRYFTRDVAVNLHADMM